MSPIQNFRRIFIYLPALLADLGFAILLVGGVLYGTKLGASISEVGWIGSAYGFSYLLMPGIIGRLGDKLSRKTSLIIAAASQISIASFFLFGAATIFDLILGQILLGIANGFHWPALEAYISEETGQSIKSHTRGMANFCISWSIGYSLGPLLAGFFSDYNVQDSFLLVVCIYAVNLCVVAFGLPPIKGRKNDVPPQEIIVPGQNAPETERKASNRGMYALLIGMIVYAGVAKVILTYFTNYAKLPEGLNWSGTLLGLVLLCFGLGRTCYFLTGGFIKNSVRLVQVAFLMTGGLLATLIFLRDPWLITVVMVIFGFFGGLIYLQTLEMLLWQEQRAKGAKAGLFESTIGLGGSLSPLFAGFLGEISLMLPFGVFSGLVFLFFVLNYVLARNLKKEN